MAADAKAAVAHVQLVDGYRFITTFPDVAGANPIMLDEAAPLGTGAGPTPAGLLAAAVGGCLSASLTLCLNKAHLEPDAVNAHVTARMGRNEGGDEASRLSDSLLLRARIDGAGRAVLPAIGQGGKYEHQIKHADKQGQVQELTHRVSLFLSF